MIRTLTLTLLVVLASLQVADAAPFSNTKWLNTKWLNTKWLNTADLGTLTGGATFYKPSTGQTYPGVILDRATFRSSNGASGDDFVGTWTTATLGDNTQTYTYIAGRYLPFSAYPDTYLYWVYTWAPNIWNVWDWRPSCPDRHGGSPHPAIPLAGEWNQDTGARISYGGSKFTWACTNGALGKCASSGDQTAIGYTPWRPTIYYQAAQDANGGWYLVLVDGQRTHQACTRMLRADYCGDGQDHTEDGTQIDVRDFLWSGNEVSAPSYLAEALWNEDGAVWISCSRDATSFAAMTTALPDYSGLPPTEFVCKSNGRYLRRPWIVGCNTRLLPTPEDVFGPEEIYGLPGNVLLGNGTTRVTP